MCEVAVLFSLAQRRRGVLTENSVGMVRVRCQVDFSTGGSRLDRWLLSFLSVSAS